MNGGVILVVEVDPERIEKRVKTGYCEVMTRNLDEALDLALSAKRSGTAKSIGLVGNAAEVHRELLRRDILPDLMTDQTSAHDPLNGYVPAGLSLQESLELRARKPEEHIRRALDSMAIHVQTMLEFQKLGAVVFDYGNNIRQQALGKGCRTPSISPVSFRPSSARCSAPGTDLSAGQSSPAIPPTSPRSTTWRYGSSRTTRTWSAGSRWRGRRSISRVCPPHLLAWVRRARSPGRSWSTGW